MIKKVFIILLVVSMLFGICACFKKENVESNIPIETQTATETITETVGPIGLGRIWAENVIIETNAVEETEEPVKAEAKEPVKTETKEPAQSESKEQSDFVENTKPETQPVEETVSEDELNWGGGRT